MNYICNYCKIKFSTKSSLIRHQKNKHKLNNVSSSKYNSKCSLCKMSFPKKTLLIDHLNECHGMNIVKQIIEFSNVSEFQDWLKKYEFDNHCEYVLSTGKKKCKDGKRSYYECCRTGFHKAMGNSKRRIKSQGSKKINQNCTSHIILLDYLNQVKCVATFYKEHHGHNEKELQHIRIPIKKKREIAAKLAQGMTLEEVLENLRDNIESDLKREDLITRADLHNIKQKYNIKIQDDQLHKNDLSDDVVVKENNPVIYYEKQGIDNTTIPMFHEELHTTAKITTEMNSLEIAYENNIASNTNEIENHINSLENLNNNKLLYSKFKETASGIINKIHLIENYDHLKEAMKKLNILDAFINATLNEFGKNKEIKKFTCDPPNKKIAKPSNFYFTKNKREKNTNELSKPSAIETIDLINIIKKINVIKKPNEEHSYCKKTNL